MYLILGHAYMDFSSPSEIDSSISQYNEILFREIENRKEVFPINPYNVKFNRNELEVLKKVGRQLLIDLNKTKKFDEFIWDRTS